MAGNNRVKFKKKMNGLMGLVWYCKELTWHVSLYLYSLGQLNNLRQNQNYHNWHQPWQFVERQNLLLRQLSLFLLAKYQGSDFLTGYFIYNYLSMQRRIICDYCQKSCYKLSARQYFLFSSWILHIVACFIINVEVLEIVVVISSESTKKIFIVKVFYSLSYILISSLFST